ncbi:MAG: hypothetical protein U0744_18160 [Gemmataceae bacterium]
MWKTKDPDCLECRFVGPSGLFNLSRIEKFGIQPAIKPSREGEVIVLSFKNESQVRWPELKALLTEHLAAFKKTHKK